MTASFSARIIWPPPGRYLLAVSGGADSIVLLDLMAAAAAQKHYELIVAHCDHGLRAQSGSDARFVQAAAAAYHLPSLVHQAGLGQASEAQARAARHAWLEAARQAEGGVGVMTAHHHDDLIETSLLNLARGSGRHGLAPMGERGQGRSPILRPLLRLSRSELRAYAAAHHLEWREDATNADLTNPRNFLRARLLPAAPPAWPAQYGALMSELEALNTAIDHELAALLAAHRTPAGYQFPPAVIANLSLAALAELILSAAHELSPGLELGSKLLAELVDFVRTPPTSGRPRRRHRPLRAGLWLEVEHKHVRVVSHQTPQN